VETPIENLKIDGPLPKEPQSLIDLTVPNIRVGYTEQWLDVSPEIVQFWEKALLEPYSQSKKVCCILNDEFLSLTMGIDSILCD
jgi:hypothetical protein